MDPEIGGTLELRGRIVPGREEYYSMSYIELEQDAFQERGWSMAPPNSAYYSGSG